MIIVNKLSINMSYIYNIYNLYNIYNAYNIYNIKWQNLDISKVWRVKVNTDKNKRKSAIIIVEVNGEPCIDRHNKKGDAGKDHSLWRRKVTFGFAADMIYPHITQINGSPVLLRPHSRDPFQLLARATASSGFPVSTAVAPSSSSAFLRN